MSVPAKEQVEDAQAMPKNPMGQLAGMNQMLTAQNAMNQQAGLWNIGAVPGSQTYTSNMLNVG